MIAGPDEAGRLAASLTPHVRELMERAAGEALLPNYQRLTAAEVREKSPDELVTTADLESEAILSAGLATILSGAAIVGEEAAHADPDLVARLGEGLCWIVDPLDGTGNFAHGSGPFGIIVALSFHGIAVGGWILDPVSGRFCSAALGQGAWVGDDRASVALVERGRPIAALSPLLRSRPGRFEQVSERLTPTHDLVEIPRCAAEHYPAMVLGAADLTIYERTLAWDHAAGVLLLQEAGGHCARLDGSSYRVDDGRTGLLVASSKQRWDEASWLLRDVPA
jgi:fructose-1,6-bisphosphatase/inositol monophosphatase family enzyme